jgi:hypothetical protein
MSTQTTVTTKTPAEKNARRAARRAGKKKLASKIVTDREFAKTYFGAKSKRAADKKSAYRKKKSKKK